jgi:outer membrane biosynthesis protein TonB
MKKSGLADSPFFVTNQLPKKPEGVSPIPTAAPRDEKEVTRPEEKPKPETIKPNNRDVKKPRNRDTTVSRYDDAMIELVRKAVREFGKEAATHRFTLDEKRAIADIIYSYRNSEIKTSENEITRIAVNFIINDFKENGKNSVLDKVLKVLNG